MIFPMIIVGMPGSQNTPNSPNTSDQIEYLKSVPEDDFRTLFGGKRLLIKLTAYATQVENAPEIN